MQKCPVFTFTIQLSKIFPTTDVFSIVKTMLIACFLIGSQLLIISNEFLTNDQIKYQLSKDQVEVTKQGKFYM